MLQFKHIALSTMALVFAGCDSVYRDEVQPMTDQEISDYKQFSPEGALRSGVFHMQLVESGSNVRVADRIVLKRPDLPPFDVAYISRNVEQVLLELSHAAGESIVIPQGLRNRTVTVVHSGANFEEMMNIILSKVGYHYNYIDGVWYVTRYPVRTYQVEVGQSERSGSIISSREFSPEVAAGQSTGGSSQELDTKYTDSVWDQIKETLDELIDVGSLQAASGGSAPSASAGVKANGSFLSEAAADMASAEGEGASLEEDLFGTITDNGGLAPAVQERAPSTDHLLPEEQAEPWFKMTRSAGIITVRAAPEAHRLIEEYLDQLQETSLRQVQVEVRILALTKDRETVRGANFSGDNYDLFDSVLGSVGFESQTPVVADAAKGFTFSASKMSGTNTDLSMVIQMLSKNASVYNISSPSVLARNNQLSRISLTRQLGYAETEVEQKPLRETAEMESAESATASGRLSCGFEHLSCGSFRLLHRLHRSCHTCQ